VAGLAFPNRVGLAAGLDKNAAHIDALGRFGFGFIEVGTVTPLAQPGNPRPRLFRIPSAQAIVNRFGFNNHGLRAFLENVQRSQWVRERRGILGLNIGKNAATPVESALDDYRIGLAAVFPYADYITINISSPNTKALRSLQAGEALRALLEPLREDQARLSEQHSKRVPLFLKIAPDLNNDEIDAIAETCNSIGIEGLIATNTTLDRTAVEGMPNATQTGGLSGAPLLEKSNAVLERFKQQLRPNTALIGVGGIASADDGLAKVAAGADLVQVYSGLIYRGPGLVADLAKAL
jgi:dihydroorotate dehydrogenase